MGKLGEGIIEDLRARVSALEESAEKRWAGNRNRMDALAMRISTLEARNSAEDDGLRAAVDVHERIGAEVLAGVPVPPTKRTPNSAVPNAFGNQTGRGIECGNAEPAKPVATVGVECPRCDPPGSGYISVWTKAAIKRGDEHPSSWNKCPTCLGAGLVHTDAEFQRVAKELERHKRALNIATYRVNPTAHEYLHKADAELSAEAAEREATT